MDFFSYLCSRICLKNQTNIRKIRQWWALAMPQAYQKNRKYILTNSPDIGTLPV